MVTDFNMDFLTQFVKCNYYLGVNFFKNNFSYFCQYTKNFEFKLYYTEEKYFDFTKLSQFLLNFAKLVFPVCPSNNESSNSSKQEESETSIDDI